MAYCYLIGWSEHDKWYYGVRYAKGCKPSDLMVSYHTSSKYVKQFIAENGSPDIVQVRRVFDDKAKAIKWEDEVHRKMNVVKDPRWLNKGRRNGATAIEYERNWQVGVEAARIACTGRQVSDNRRQQMRDNMLRMWAEGKVNSKKPADTSNYSRANKLNWQNPEYKEKTTAAMKEGWSNKEETPETRAIRSEASLRGWEKWRQDPRYASVMAAAAAKRVGRKRKPKSC